MSTEHTWLTIWPFRLRVLSLFVDTSRRMSWNSIHVCRTAGSPLTAWRSPVDQLAKRATHICHLLRCLLSTTTRTEYMFRHASCDLSAARILSSCLFRPSLVNHDSGHAGKCIMMSRLQYCAYPGQAVEKRISFSYSYSQAVRVGDRIERAGQGMQHLFCSDIACLLRSSGDWDTQTG
jgi:hypothetical protein